MWNNKLTFTLLNPIHWYATLLLVLVLFPGLSSCSNFLLMLIWLYGYHLTNRTGLGEEHRDVGQARIAFLQQADPWEQGVPLRCSCWDFMTLNYLKNCAITLIHILFLLSWDEMNLKTKSGMRLEINCLVLWNKSYIHSYTPLTLVFPFLCLKLKKRRKKCNN